MVALPMTPAAPVTTATLPSNLIRSAMRYPLLLRLARIFGARGGTAHPFRKKTIPFVAGTGQRRPIAADRPFPAVFGVLTGGRASGG